MRQGRRTVIILSGIIDNTMRLCQTVVQGMWCTASRNDGDFGGRRDQMYKAEEVFSPRAVGLKSIQLHLERFILRFQRSLFPFIHAGHLRKTLRRYSAADLIFR